MATELFPNLQKRIIGKQFWEDAARWVLAGYEEEAVFKVMDPDGAMRTEYPRPDSFPDCFATVQPQSATVQTGGGGSKPIGAMSSDAR